MGEIERALEILGVGPDSTPQDIKLAYRDLAKVWHPDRFPNDSRVRRKAEEKLKEINHAYKVLQGYDPVSRGRSRPNANRKTEPKPENEHQRPDDSEQYSSSPPFGRKGDGRTASPIPKFKNRIPRWAYIIGVILAIRVGGHLVEMSKTERTYRPSTPTYAPGPVVVKQPDSFPPPKSGDPKIVLPPTGQDVITAPTIASPKQIDRISPDRPKASGSEIHGSAGPPIPAPTSALREKTNRVPEGFFSLGSTKDEVLAIQGTPNEINDRYWKYGYSRVDFKGDRVVSWDVSPSSPLKVRAKDQ